MVHGTVTGKNRAPSPAFGSNLRFTFSLLSSPTSRKLFQSTKKYRPLLGLVGRTGLGARVVPPKDSSSAARFARSDVDSEVGVTASDKSEASFAESEVLVEEEATVVVVVVGVVVVVVVVVVGVVVEETSTDAADKMHRESPLDLVSRASTPSHYNSRANSSRFVALDEAGKS